MLAMLSQVNKPRLRLDLYVKYLHFLYNRLQPGDNRLVCGIHQIVVTILNGREVDHEHVGEAILAECEHIMSARRDVDERT